MTDRQRPSSTRSSQVGARVIRDDAPRKTALEGNSFAILNATLRDSRARILELSIEKALDLDEGQCRAAAAEISNPRTRLTAEISWLPGISPSRARSLLAGVRENPDTARSTDGVFALAATNLISSALELIGPGLKVDDWVDWIDVFAEAADVIEPERVLREINEDRAVGSFPAVPDVSWIEAALGQRRRDYKDVVLSALDRLPSRLLVAILNKVLTHATAGGHSHAPILVEDICAAYELRSTTALERGADGIRKVIQAAREHVGVDGGDVMPYLKRIDSLTREWDALAQPIQLLKKSHGSTHEASSALAHAIRSFAIDIVNKHGLVDEGTRLTQLLSDVFTEVSEVAERLEADATALGSLVKQRDARRQSREEWAQEISYTVEIGAFAKRPFSISLEGVSWKGDLLPLEAITRLRWGATRHSVNGIPTGTTYSVAVGDDAKQISCVMRQQEAWDEITTRLWRAVGVRLVVNLLTHLRSGAKCPMGGAIIDDLGMTLPRHALFGDTQPVYLLWKELHIWTSDGSFYVGSQRDKKVYVSLPYQTCDNVHIFEGALRSAFKSPVTRLSDLLES